MNKKLFLFVLLPVLLAACQSGSSLQVDKPTVESRQNPDGIGITQPRFSWQLASPLNDVMQAAYQIEVAASETGLKHGRDLLWEHRPRGKATNPSSSPTQQAPAVGHTLLLAGDRGTTTAAKPPAAAAPPCSQNGSWSTALLPPALRKTDGKPVRAMLYVSGLGASVDAGNAWAMTCSAPPTW